MSKKPKPKAMYPAIEIADNALALLNIVLEENYRLHLAIGLMKHRRKRGRPQKIPKDNKQKKNQGRQKVDYSWLPECVAELKKRYGVTENTKAIDCQIENLQKHEGREIAYDLKKKTKRLLNVLSEKRKKTNNPK